VLLAQLNPIAFIPTTNFEVAREFYEFTLGLNCVAETPYAVVFRVGPANIMLRVALTDNNFTPAPYTIFGWEVDNLHAVVGELTAKGVEFLHYDHVEQSPDGVWSAPGGDSVAWFKDLDGNVLSLSHHP
jgi:catechol 2,3-dioxygenase-like lactoylglutathione lyase family enzyme